MVWECETGCETVGEWERCGSERWCGLGDSVGPKLDPSLFCVSTHDVS